MPVSDDGWLVGVGIADVTGEPWDVGLMGYGMPFQRSTGIHLRQRSRAFVFVDRSTGKRLVYVWGAPAVITADAQTGGVVDPSDTRTGCATRA